MVFISSVAAFTGRIVDLYYTTKAGLIGLGHALADPLAPHDDTMHAVRGPRAH
jgi:NAD(P)-dependent dehydrogenase (short-subunit alcohol dehydrogenase family)